MWRWLNTIIATNTFSENAAHVLAGYGALITAALFHWPMAPTVLGCLAAAALKEYAYDARFEQPHQTFTMNTTDFAGYVVGIIAGLGAAHAL